MSSRIIIILLMSLLLIPLVSALPNESIVAVWDFNGTNPSERGRDNNTLHGPFDLSPSGTLAGGSDRNGNTNSAVFFDGTDDFFNFSNFPSLTQDDFTLTFWINWSDTGVADDIFECQSGNTGVRILTVSTNLLRDSDNNDESRNSVTNLSQGVWTHIALVRNGSASTTRFYFNGSADPSSAMTHDMVSCSLKIGEQAAGAGDLTGSLDEMCLWNESLSGSNITSIFENGCGGFLATYEAVADTTPPVITIHLPANDSITADDPIAFTVSADENTQTCQLFSNETGSFAIEDTNISGNADVNFTLNHDTSPTPAKDELYEYYVQCNDTVGNAGNSSRWLVFFDTTDPIITWRTPSDDNGTNTSGTLISDIQVDNTNLDDVFWNITQGSTLIYSNETLNLANVDQYNITDTIDLSNNASGVYTYAVKGCDNPVNCITATANFTLDMDAPTITLNTSDNSNFTVNLTITLQYTPSDTLLMVSSCRLYTNHTALNWSINQTDTGIEGDALNEFNLTINESNQTVLWNVQCNDTVGNSAFAAANFTFDVIDAIIVSEVITVGYNESLIAHTQWFNLDAFATDSIEGWLAYFWMLLFFVIAFFAVEIFGIPILKLIVGIGLFFFSFLIFSTISVIVGMLIAVISVIYTIIVIAKTV